MARRVLIGNIEREGEEHPYTLIESLDDIGVVPTHAPDTALVECFLEGKQIIINRMGGYCFYEADSMTMRNA